MALVVTSHNALLFVCEGRVGGGLEGEGRG